MYQLRAQRRRTRDLDATRAKGYHSNGARGRAIAYAISMLGTLLWVGCVLPAGSIADEFPITRASLSHHFNILKAADLVRTERRGQHIVYSLNATVLQEAMTMLLDLFSPADSSREQKQDGSDTG
mgnify:CR=1 FL=1